MKVSIMNILKEKAKTRKDGIYSYKGYMWVVRNNKFVAFADRLGNCYEVFGSFTVSMGKVKSYERKDRLKDWLKKDLR